MSTRSAVLCVAMLLAACGRSDSGDSGLVVVPGTASSTANHTPIPTLLDLGEGLVVEVLDPGRGSATSITPAGSRVRFHYSAFVAGSTEPFDTTKKTGIPLEVALASDAKPRPIAGLERALRRLAEGARANVTIPAALGWGEAGNPSAGVPPNSDLRFEVEVVEVRE